MVEVRGERSRIRIVRAGVPQGSVLGPVLYTLFTSDLPCPNKPGTILATYADDTAFIANASCPIEASRITQEFLDSNGKWTNRWNVSINGRKSQHCKITLRGKILPREKLLDITIPQSLHAQYLGLILDKRLTWKQHTTKIAATCRAKLRKLNLMLKPTSKLTLGNKILLFKTIVVPSMTYCIQLWGMASDSNVMKVQNRALRMIADAPRYVRNDALTTDHHVPSVREQINRHSSRYNDRLTAHINHLAASLAHPRTRRRLKRRHPGDLWTKGRQVSRVLNQ